MSSDAETATAPSNLCARCSSLNLVAANLYLTEEEAKKPEPENAPDSVNMDQRSWHNIEASQKCDLRRMIKSAVEASRFEWQSAETPNLCEINTERPSGIRDIAYDVRYLEIVAYYDWTSSNDIALLPVETPMFPGCFPGRIVDESGLDTHRINAWIDLCQSTHGDICKYSETTRFHEIRESVLGCRYRGNENLTTWQYIRQLALNGLHLGMLKARYHQKLIHDQIVVKAYTSMVCELEKEENITESGEKRLTLGFWVELQMWIARRNLEATFPGHCEATLRPLIDSFHASE